MKKLFISLLLAFTILSITPALRPIVSPMPAMAQQPESDLKGSGFMFKLRAVTHEGVEEEKWISGGINFIFERAITIMAATVGAAAVMMITVGGFMILASAGRQSWIDKGKNYIFKSLIGLAVALFAYIIVTAVQLLIKSIYG